MSNSFQSLNTKVNELREHTDNEIYRLDGLVSETAQETLSNANLYTDEEIEKANVNTLNILNAYQLQVNNQIAEFFRDITTRFTTLNTSFEELEVQFTKMEKLVVKNFKSVNEQLLTLQQHLRQNYELAFDANRNSNNAIELANQLAVAVNGYADRFIYFDFDLINLRESLKYVNSGVIRSKLSVPGLYNIRVGTLNINDDLTGGDINVNPTVYRIVIEKFEFNPDTQNVVKSYQYAETYSFNKEEYTLLRVVSIIDHSTFAIQARTMDDGSILFEVMNCCNNEFNKVYFDMEPITPPYDINEIIVDIDIHPTPPPPPKPEPCKPIPIVIVNKQCEEIDMRPEPGRDGRDGRDGASVDDITLTVKP